MTYIFLQQYWWFIISLLGALLVFLMFVQGANSLVYLASEAGWIVAELGRQPWAIQDMLPTVAAVSDISSSSVALTFFIFLVLFSVLLFAEIRIMCRVIKNYKPQIEQAD